MSSPKKISDDELIELYRTKGPTFITKTIGLSPKNVYVRRRKIEKKFGIEIVGPNGPVSNKIPPPKAIWRLETDFKDGVIIVASDLHYWPSEVPFMHHVLVQFIKELKPKIMVLNGDVLDLPKISRHAAIGWERRPEVQEEIEFGQEMTHEIVQALPRGARKIWTMGNHDERFSTRLANQASEYARVCGFQLKDHFPLWEPAYQVFVNPSAGHEAVLIHHRYKGGEHAVSNNLKWTGCHTVTGHLHKAEVRALTYYNDRTIWGVDTGCIAEPNSRAFEYTRGAPTGWRQGFGVLTFKDGRLLQPELVQRWHTNNVQFRGQIIKV